MENQRMGEGMVSRKERIGISESPLVGQSHSDPTPTRVADLITDSVKDDASNAESRDTVLEPAFHTSMLQNTHLCPYSVNIHHYSPASSRPASPFSSSRPSRPSLASSVTSTTISVNVSPDGKDSEPSTRRPSLRGSLRARLRSSISSHGASRPPIHPSEFQNAPEQPEKHFIDSIGMVIPGVCNRIRCEHSRTHFVSHWRLCEPTEYTTALADHGITYVDFSRLMTALANFLEDIPNEPKQRRRAASWWYPQRRKPSTDSDNSTRGGHKTSPFVRQNIFAAESERQYIMAKQQAEDLNGLLEKISWHWRQRGLPVVVCISSYSLFAPNRISESHIQILHVPLEASMQPEVTNSPRVRTRLSFIDPFTIAKSAECGVVRPRLNQKQRSVSPHSIPLNGSHLHHRQQLQRDKTRPWPLWPNAIPSRKREQMNANADRYGVDPYFRAWMRADINSRTKCTSYAKYMIERENNPLINKRLEYIVPPLQESLVLGLFGLGSKKKFKGSVNRTYYEHNRQLECRKAIENGARLRIIRFGFRHPIYPPHNPEMDALGLTREKYNTIISDIENIRQSAKSTYYGYVSNVFTSMNKFRRRNTVDALNKVSEYIRQINAAGRRIVWTIEKIPCVYDQGLKCDKQEWEISAWNGEDPLELLIQLEKWGIIEKRLGIDDDE